MSEQTTAGRRILLVEDEVMILMLLEDLLEDLGYVVAAKATRPAEAVAALAATEVDGVILDLNLNGENTFEIADVLIARAIPFLFMTGYSDIDMRPDLRGRPMLQKPFQHDQLGASLNGLFADGRR